MNTKRKILTAAAAGLAVGSALGVLFAPDNGKSTRKKIEDKSKKLVEGVKSTIEKGKEKFTSLKGSSKNAIIDKVEPFS